MLWHPLFSSLSVWTISSRDLVWYVRAGGRMDQTSTSHSSPSAMITWLYPILDLSCSVRPLHRHKSYLFMGCRNRVVPPASVIEEWARPLFLLPMFSPDPHALDFVPRFRPRQFLIAGGTLARHRWTTWPHLESTGALGLVYRCVRCQKRSITSHTQPHACRAMRRGDR